LTTRIRTGRFLGNSDLKRASSVSRSPLTAEVWQCGFCDRQLCSGKFPTRSLSNKKNISCNARMGTRDLKMWCVLDEATLELLKMAMAELKLSARAYDRILKVARTIADLAAAERISSDHISEAIQYRSLDRQLWA